MTIIRKSAAEIEQMRAAGRIVADILKQLAAMCVPGTRTMEFERRAAEIIETRGAVSLFKNYPHYGGGDPFPATVCVSMNEEVVHGIPGERALVRGDIVSFDVGVKVDGFCGDAAATVPVGQVNGEVRRLMDVT